MTTQLRVPEALLLLLLGSACRSPSPESIESSPAEGADRTAPAVGRGDGDAAKDAPAAPRPVDAEELAPEDAEVRRAKAAEARVGLARLMDAAHVIHETEHICHLWPKGKIGPVPPIDVRCEEGPDRACVVVDPPEEPDDPWEYSASAWDTPQWRALEYRRYDDHHYRYSVEWHFEGTGDDRACVTLVTAVGDLDGDGVLGEFQRRSPPFSRRSTGEPEFTRIVNELE